VPRDDAMRRCEDAASRGMGREEAIDDALRGGFASDATQQLMCDAAETRDCTLLKGGSRNKKKA
jgi:hypothetical protein